MTAPATARSLYVTGTDTGVGKTVASVALVRAWRARGLRTIGMKPVASGCERTPEGWRNADALRLQAASDPRPAYGDLNPWALPAATAPEFAAREVGATLTIGPILDAHARLAAQADLVVVEGVGGWAAPIDDGLVQADLVGALSLPVVLVVGLRLGCLNHAALTARAIAADGGRLSGWIASEIEPDMPYRDDNLAWLQRHLPAPCWGVLPFRADADEADLSGFLSPR
ncbi:MAG: dethiobiotin synthase [Xanthomonadales bacterium]|nr:dethiobiotin synthase [Xanthomonadales bacterium]